MAITPYNPTYLNSLYERMTKLQKEIAAEKANRKAILDGNRGELAAQRLLAAKTSVRKLQESYQKRVALGSLPWVADSNVSLNNLTVEQVYAIGTHLRKLLYGA